MSSLCQLCAPGGYRPSKHACYGTNRKVRAPNKHVEDGNHKPLPTVDAVVRRSNPHTMFLHAFIVSAVHSWLVPPFQTSMLCHTHVSASTQGARPYRHDGDQTD